MEDTTWIPYTKTLQDPSLPYIEATANFLEAEQR